MPLSVCGTATAQIDRNVEQCSRYGPYQFSLLPGPLEMQSAQHTAMRHRFILLHEGDINTGLTVLFSPERLHETAARILKQCRLHDNQSLDWRICEYEIHDSILRTIVQMYAKIAALQICPCNNL